MDTVMGAENSLENEKLEEQVFIASFFFIIIF
jgi:small basic protein